MDLKNFIRNIQDFPKPGIRFKDITPLLADAEAFRVTVDRLLTPFRQTGIQQVVGMESRGFIFGATVARELHAGFIPVRKPNRLPFETHRVEYSLEYGTNGLEIHRDALKAGTTVLIIDDLLATGGTALGAKHLVEKLGGRLAGFAFVIELTELKGRERLGSAPVHTLVQF